MPAAAQGQLDIFTPKDRPGLELCSASRLTIARPAHVHDAFELGALLEGTVHLRHGQRIWTATAPHLFLVPPGQVHSNRTVTGTRATVHLLYLPVETLDDLLREAAPRALDAATLPLLISDASDCDALRGFVELCRALRSGQRLTQDTSLLRALSALLLRHGRLPPLPAGRERKAMHRAHEYLRAHLRENVSLATLSSVAGLSQFHLVRAFHAEFGVPPHRLLNQLRIARAKALLRQGRDIAAVAVELGFADQSHFGRLFKRTEGCTPGAYRLSLR